MAKNRGFLLGLSWLLAVFEPYGLRLRHGTMCLYYPDKAKERAVWLYNHIIRKRLTFLKYIRRELRRTFGGAKYDKITLTEFLRANINSRCLRRFLGKDESRGCLLCGIIERDNTRENFIKCLQPDCVGFYCRKCFQDLKNLCPICKHPLEYGDISDISEEVDSSEEEELKGRNKKSPKQDTDGETTDNEESIYSFHYQHEEKNKPNIDKYESSSFVDLEKQRFSDYASMNHFKNKNILNGQFDTIKEDEAESNIQNSKAINERNILKNEKSEHNLLKLIFPFKKKTKTEQEQPLLSDENEGEMSIDTVLNFPNKQTKNNQGIETIFHSHTTSPFESVINLSSSEIEEFASDTTKVASTIFNVKKDLDSKEKLAQNVEKNALKTDQQVHYATEIEYFNPLPFNLTKYKVNKYLKSLTNLPITVYSFTQMFEYSVKFLKVNEFKTHFDYRDESQLQVPSFYFNDLSNFETSENIDNKQTDENLTDTETKQQDPLSDIESFEESVSSSQSNIYSESTDSFIKKSRDYYKSLRKRHCVKLIEFKN